MGAEQAIHFHDIDFDIELKKLVLNEFQNFENDLRNFHIIKNEYDDAEEAIMFETDSIAERFFYQHKEDLRLFLIKNCGYVCNGTSVWLQMPEDADIVKYFQNLISNFK